MDETKIVKCACGLTMRQKKWLDHWRSCYKGSPIPFPVTDQDIKDLEWYENNRKEREAAHKKWLDDGGPSKSKLCIKNGTLSVCSFCP